MKQSTLIFYDKRMKWTSDPKVPMLQGAWIQQLINEYDNIKVMMYGIDGTRIGLRDSYGNKSFWKFDGKSLIPLGTISVKNIKSKENKKI